MNKSLEHGTERAQDEVHKQGFWESDNQKSLQTTPGFEPMTIPILLGRSYK